jgi:hypothetical protein
MHRSRRATPSRRQRLRRSITGVILTLTTCGVVPLLVAAPAEAAFSQCPAVGLDTSCGTLITVSPGSPPTATIAFDTTQGPYEGADDTLVGVQNNTGADVLALRIDCASCPNAIFGFDGDGLCTVSPSPAACPFGSTGYEGPNVKYTNYCAPSCNTGTVQIDFGPTSPCGKPTSTMAYFSLEDSLSAASVLTVTVLTPKAQALSNLPSPQLDTGVVDPTNSPITLTGPGGSPRVHGDATYTAANADAETAQTTIPTIPPLVIPATRADATTNCTAGGRFFSGSTTAMNFGPLGTINPGPNTVVTLPQCGPGGQMVLNEQVPIMGGDGLQVTAVDLFCPQAGVREAFSVARVWYG